VPAPCEPAQEPGPPQQCTPEPLPTPDVEDCIVASDGRVSLTVVIRDDVLPGDVVLPPTLQRSWAERLNVDTARALLANKISTARVLSIGALVTIPLIELPWHVTYSVAALQAGQRPVFAALTHGGSGAGTDVAVNILPQQ